MKHKEKRGNDAKRWKLLNLSFCVPSHRFHLTSSFPSLFLCSISSIPPHLFISISKTFSQKIFVARFEPGTHEIKIPWDKSIGPFIENSVQTNFFRKIGGAKKLVDILTGRRCFGGPSKCRPAKCRPAF